MVHETTIPHTTIAIGPKLREQLRQELRGLFWEWNFAGRARRREITRHITAIYELIGSEGDRDNG